MGRNRAFEAAMEDCFRQTWDSIKQYAPTAISFKCALRAGHFEIFARFGLLRSIIDWTEKNVVLDYMSTYSIAYIRHEFMLPEDFSLSCEPVLGRCQYAAVLDDNAGFPKDRVRV